MKTLDTLVGDIYDLFAPDKPHEISEERLDAFGETLKDIVRSRLMERPKDFSLRFSNLGKAPRQIWMAAHPSPEDEPLTPKTYFKFLYGDVIEALLLFLAAEAGHEVAHQQEEIEVDGVKGHIDAIIDGTVVDVKSASSFGFKKFRENSVIEDDPFGYVQQLSGYAHVLTPGAEAAWLAMDKSSASLAVSKLSAAIIKDHDPGPVIEGMKAVVQQDEPPPLCHQPVPDGKSGNMKLATGCSYCPHKFRCFPQTRVFLYSGGPRYLSRVVEEPRVPEIRKDDVVDE